MGLLDDLLNAAGGQAMGSQASQGGPSNQPAGGGMSQIMVALLPVVLAMLSQGQGQAAPAGRSSAPSAPGGLGGLGGLLGSLFGGRGGAGGLGDLLAQFQRAGLGAEADSWVSRGQNLPLPPGGVDKVFGPDAMAEIAQRAGISQGDASRGLSALLPEVIDHVTPDGKMPGLDTLAASVDALGRRSRGV